jgi:RNA polymerase sigma factor for flagellar operon FliA
MMIDMTTTPRTGAASSAAEEPSGRTAADRALYERYLPIVRRIAMRMVRRLPREITFDDLLSAGWIGLVEALRRRGECSTEEQFEAYASHRIRGAILDYLRSLDPMSRKMRGASREITSAIKMLTSRLGRAPTEEEVAGELGLLIDDYHMLLGQVAQADPARIELTDFSEAGSDPDFAPDMLLSQREMVSRVADAIDALPEKLQLVLSLYYQEECSLREIGEVLGVTESRACQLHSEAIHHLRARLDLTAPAKKYIPANQQRAR